MARKKKLDKLSQDMIQCAKDGFGVHYGRWKATQEVVVPVKDDKLPKGWKLCEGCGKPFRSTCGKRFCDSVCRNQTYLKNHKEQRAELVRKWRAKKAAEGNMR